MSKKCPHCGEQAKAKEVMDQGDTKKVLYKCPNGHEFIRVEG